jgi:hypothetical protein
MSRLARHYSNVTVDCFVVMPNHVHALIVIEGKHQYSAGDAASLVSTPAELPKAKPISLASIVGSYKAGVSKNCRRRGLTDMLWQERFHDRVLSSTPQ